MKVLLINGSPKGRKSNSLKLASSFVTGYAEEAGKDGQPVDVEEIQLANKEIAPCRGCFACWKATPGLCRIHDDMGEIIEKLAEADLVVWSFPLYYFNVPGILKNMIDRQLPMLLPFMSERADGCGSGSHDSRYERKDRKHVLVSTCGFWSAEGNYDGVTAVFDHMLGKGNFETIFCGQGELFGIAELSDKTDEYLAKVMMAGSEYAKGGVSESTRSELARPLFPKEKFESMANASWGVDRENGNRGPTDLMLVEMLAERYDKTSFDGKERVLEFRFTDLGTSYQILLKKDGAEVFDDGSLETTTRIDTPFQVWLEMTRGEIGAFEALDKHLYTVDGDFTPMTRWRTFFGPLPGRSDKTIEEQLEGKLPPSMAAMLVPWVTFWVVISADVLMGAIVSIAVSIAMPIFMRKHKIIVWDWLSYASVIALSIIGMVTGNGDLVAIIGYLVFGIMWLASCFTKEPLCAAYVKYKYGGDLALDIPLFMKPNYILAAGWGVLYVLTAGWTYLAQQAGFGDTIVIVNCIIPAAMGFFTDWFSGWYPAYLARGGVKDSLG